MASAPGAPLAFSHRRRPLLKRTAILISMLAAAIGASGLDVTSFSLDADEDKLVQIGGRTSSSSDAAGARARVMFGR